MNQVRGIFGLTPEDNIGKIAFPAVQVRLLCCRLRLEFELPKCLPVYISLGCWLQALSMFLTSRRLHVSKVVRALQRGCRGVFRLLKSSSALHCDWS